MNVYQALLRDGAAKRAALEVKEKAEMAQLVTVDRATLEQLVRGVEMGFDFYDGDVFGVMSNDMVDALSAGRAALANAEPENSYDLAKRANNEGQP